MLKVRYLFVLLVFCAEVHRLCTLFANDARRQLHNILKQSGTNIKTARQLRNAIYVSFLITFNPGCAEKLWNDCMLAKFT